MAPMQSGAEQWSKSFAMVLAFAFSLGLILIMLFNKWNRPDLDSEHAAHILSQLNGFGGTGGGAVVVRSLEALDDVETLREIRGSFHGEQSSEVRVRSATREILREVRAELRARKPAVSKVPVRAVQEALLTAVFGAFAIVPVAVWREASKSGGGAVPTLPDILAVGDWIVSGVIGTLTAFPYTDVLFAFGLTFGILSVEAIWMLWWVPPVVLTILAGTYWILERRVETERDLTGPPVRTWAVRFVTLTVTTWFVGTSLATLGNALGAVLPFFVRLPLGLVLATVVLIAYVRLTTRPGKAMADGGREPEDGDDDRLGGGLSDEEIPKIVESAESEEISEIVDTGETPEGPPDPNAGLPAPTHADDGGDDGEETGPGLGERVSARVRRFLGRAGRANWKHMTILGSIGFAIAHELAAFFAAVVVMSAVVSVWLRRTLRRWTRSAERDGHDAFALDVVHSLTVTAAAMTLPLMGAYMVAAIGTGKVIRVARAVSVDAPDGTILAIGILAVMVALTAAVMFLNRFADLRMGLRRALSVQSVRLALFGKALPFALMVITAIISLAVFGTNFVGVIAVTLAVGLIARFAFQVYHTANYRYQTRDSRDKGASRVVVNGRKVTDANDEPVFIADVNGHRTAHRRLEPLISQIREDARSLFTDGHAEKGSFARYYYKNGVKRGKVDMGSVADELLGDIRTRFEANVKKTDASASDIMEKLRSEYPNHVVKKVIQSLKNKGAVSRREDRFVWLGK